MVVNYEIGVESKRGVNRDSSCANKSDSLKTDMSGGT
jgi:hypothetical protein